MDALIRLISQTIIRGTIYRTIFKAKSMRVILPIAALACVAYVAVQK